MIKNTIAIFTFFIMIHAFSQDQIKIDSLLQVLESNIDEKEKIDTYIILAKQYSYTDTIQTSYYAKQAINLAKQIDYNKGIADAYYEIGQSKMYMDASFAETAAIFQKSFKYAKISYYHLGKVNALNSLGVINKNNDNYEQAIDFYNKALKIQEEQGLSTALATSYNNIGVVYKLQGKYKEALKYYYKTLKIDKESGNKKHIAGSYANIGIIHKMSGNYPNALDYYLKSVRICEEIGNKKYIANNYNNIGGLFHEQKDYQSALIYHFKSLKIREELDHKSGIATSYSNIGLTYSSIRNYEQAFEYLFKSLAINKELNSVNGTAINFVNIGELFFQTKKYEEAITYLKKGVSHTDKSEAVDMSVTGMNILGEAFYQLKDYEQARIFLTKSILQAQKIDFSKGIRNGAETLAKVHKALGNHKAALESYELYHATYDSLLGEEKSKQLSQLQVQYETEKKEQEIKSLAQQASIQSLELKQANFNKTIFGVVSILLLLVGLVLYLVNRQKQLALKQRAQNIEQNLLRVQMNPHFIFNAMTSIQDYMNQGDAKKASLYLVKFSKLIRQVLDNSRSEFISLDQEINMLDNYLSIQNLKRDHPFNFTIEVQEDLSIEEIAIPPMFAQPFVENAIEHGVTNIKEGATITIHFSMEGDHLVLKISDNGSGIEEAMKIKRKDHVSHAIQITEERIDLYRKMRKKKIAFDIQNLSKGTQVTFNLPFQYV